MPQADIRNDTSPGGANLGASGEIRLAWRNVGRNPRRTALTIASTVFAVYLTVCFVGMSEGVHAKMIEDSVRIHSGHVMLAAQGYLEERTLDHYVELEPALVRILDAEPQAEGWAPRVMSFGLLSHERASQGTAVLGVDPQREPTVSTLASRVGKGSFLSAAPGASGEIVLGAALAHRLGAEIGDELLLYGAAYSLETAYELFRLVGLFELPEPDLERSLAVISLADAQRFYVYEGRVNEIAVLASEAGSSASLRASLLRSLDPLDANAATPVLAHTWDEVMPDLEQMLALDSAGMWVMLAILVIVVGFGILNTVLMAVLERTRELGVMLALGMRPATVFRVVYLESLMLAGFGLATGIALAVPCVLWFAANPITLTGSLEATTSIVGMEPVLTAVLRLSDLVWCSLSILLVALLAATYPSWKASRGQPVEALRSI